MEAESHPPTCAHLRRPQRAPGQPQPSKKEEREQANQLPFDWSESPLLGYSWGPRNDLDADDGTVYPGLSFQTEVAPTDHPIWKVLLTFLSSAALPKKTQARLVLALTQPPASAGKPKTFTQLGRDARSPQEFVRARAAQPTRGAPLKGPVFLSTARQGWPDRKHHGHPQEVREKVLENEGQQGPGVWGRVCPQSVPNCKHVCTSQPGQPATQPVHADQEKGPKKGPVLG